MENRGKDLMQIRKELLKKAIDDNQAKAVRYMQVSRENIAYFKMEFFTSGGLCFRGTIPLDVVRLDSIIKQMLQELYDYHVSERFRSEQELGMIDGKFPTPGENI